MSPSSKLMYADRWDAGEQLAKALSGYSQLDECVVLGLPRGGIIPAAIVAKRLELPLDIVLTKKIGHPKHKEYAIGAVSLTHYFVDDKQGVNEDYILDEINRLQEILQEKYNKWYQNRNPIELEGKTVIVIDDGIATGHSITAAVEMIRKQNPKKIIVAVPVSSYRSYEELREITDEIVCLITDSSLTSIGAYYQNFEQVSDKEVKELLG